MSADCTKWRCLKPEYCESWKYDGHCVNAGPCDWKREHGADQDQVLRALRFCVDLIETNLDCKDDLMFQWAKRLAATQKED